MPSESTTQWLFLSHSAEDIDLVRAFGLLLEQGVGVLAQEIFCTSLPAQKLMGGDDFIPEIHKRVNDAKVVVALITPEYYASPFCVSEMGAAWGLAKRFLPCLVPPLAYSDLKAVIRGKHAYNLRLDEALVEMRDDLQKLLPIDKNFYGVGRWVAALPAFQAALKAFLETRAVRPPATVARLEFERVSGEAADFKKAVRDIAVARDGLLKELEEVRALKDAEQLRAYDISKADEDERFAELLRKALAALTPLKLTTRIAMYYDLFNREEYFSHQAPTDFRAAKEEEEIIIAGGEDEIRTNMEHGKVEKARQCLMELDGFLSGASKSFTAAYKEKVGVEPKLSNQLFWRTHLRVSGFPEE